MGNKQSCASAHSKYSSSSAERFVNCPASIRAIERLDLVEGVASPYAQEGTNAHDCFDRYNKTDPKHWPALTAILNRQYPALMVHHAEWCARQVRAFVTPGSIVESERKVYLDWIHPEFSGTLDVSIIEEFGRLQVIDLKYGQGICVEPDRNLQLIAYSLAVAHEFDYNFNVVTLTIIQPRIPHVKGLVRSWSFNVGALSTYEEIFRRAIDNAESKRPVYAAGDHCRFCPAKLTCLEYPNARIREAQADFEDLAL